LLFVLAGTADAALITNAGNITNAEVIDFSQFTGTTLTFGPVQVGGLVGRDVVFTSTVDNADSSIPPGSHLGQGLYGLLDNGSWGNDGQTFVGFNDPESEGFMIFTFNDGPVSAVGGLVNYCICTDLRPPFEPRISVFGTGMVLLETYDLFLNAPISTVASNEGVEQENAGRFRGIARDYADIVAFGLTGSFIVLDDLRFGDARAVPAPTGVILIGLGLAWIGVVSWQLRKEQRSR
jgi:hypothetical protein